MDKQTSVRDTDKIVQSARDPPKVFTENPYRRETDMVICLACGNLHAGNDETPCPICSTRKGQSISNALYRKRFDKYTASE